MPLSLPLPKRHSVKNLFIDLDDTLWATFENNKNSLEQLYRDEGWQRFFPTFDDLFSVYMPINDQLWADFREGKIDKSTLIIDRLRLPLDRFLHYSNEQYWQLNNQFLAITGSQTRLIPYAIETLSYLSSYYRIHILSNGFMEVQYNKIRNSGLAPYIHKVILSDQAKAKKPDKEIFSYACSVTNSRVRESVMIGDSWEADVVGAVNAGMAAIWFNPRKQTPPITQEEQDSYQNVHQIHCLTELSTLF